jgi:hypothetical protein
MINEGNPFLNSISRYSNSPQLFSPHPNHTDVDACKRHLQKRIHELEEELRKEQAERTRVEAEFEKAFTHAICVGWELKLLQQQLNKKTQGKKRKLQVTAQYVTSAEASRILKEHEQAEEEKRKQEEAAQALKKAKDGKRKQQRETGGIKFTGSIMNKNRDDLLDITYAFKLTASDSNASETKAALISMINVHLDNHPQLAADETFSGLFLSCERTRQRNALGENTAPPSSSHFTLPAQSPPQPLPPPDPKPLDEPPMVLFNEAGGAVGFLSSDNPPPPFALGHNHLAPLINTVYPHSQTQRPGSPSQHPLSSRPPFYPRDFYSTPSGSQ